MIHQTRRRFIQSTAALGAGYWALGGTSVRASRSPNEEIRYACIGIGGKGDSDSTNASKNGKIVAICDIDERRLNKKSSEFPDAKTFNDYRKLFDEMENDIDAVVVSTPDHTHAVIAT